MRIELKIMFFLLKNKKEIIFNFDNKKKYL
jgi:hypothetical protein